MDVERWLGAVQYTTIKQPYQIHSFSTSQKTTNYNTVMQSQETKKQIESVPSWWQSDDAWAMIMAAGMLVIAWFALQPAILPATGETSFENLLAPWVAKPRS